MDSTVFPTSNNWANRSRPAAHAEIKAVRGRLQSGSTIEPAFEHELLAMNRNAVEFDYLSDVVSGNLKQLRLAITGHA